jgi:WD40 repeat protein
MQEWIAESRDALRSRRRIADAAAEWQRLGQDDDALLRGARLSEAREFAAAEPQLLNEDERAFVSASGAREAQERTSRERSRRRLTVAAIALAGVFMLLAVVAGIQWLGAEQNARRADDNAARAEENARAAEANAARAEDNESTAREQALVARTRQLAAQSVASHDRLDVALLLAAEAGARPDVLEARASLLDAIGEEPRLWRFLPGDSGAVRQLAFIGNGQLLSAGRAISLWDVETGRKVIDLQTAIDTRVWAETGASDLARPVFAVSADGDRVAWGSYWEEGSEAPWLSTYDVQSGATAGCGAPCAAPPLVQERARSITAMSYSEAGDSILVAVGATLHLFDAERGTFRATVVAPQPDFGFTSALSADGRWFAVAGEEEVRVWRIQDGEAAEPIVLPSPPDTGTDSFPAPYQALAFSDDGTQLAGLRGPGGLGFVDIWQVEEAAPVPFLGGTLVGWTSDSEPRRPLVDVRQLAFGGQATLWTATSAGAVEPWDLPTAGSSIAPALRGYTQQPTSLAAVSDGVPVSGRRPASTVAAGYSDGRIVIWRTADDPFKDSGHLAAPLVSDPEFTNPQFWLSTDGAAYAATRAAEADGWYAIDVLDLATAEVRHTVTLEAPLRPDLTFPILAVRLSSLDGTLAALVLGEGDDATLSVWSLETGAVIGTRSVPFVGPELPFAVSSDGQTVAVLGGGFGVAETTTLWDVMSGRENVLEREWTVDDAAVAGIAFGAGDESIISWSGNTSAGDIDLPAAVRVRAVGDDDAEQVFQIDSSSVCAVAASRDGSAFAIAYRPRERTALGVEGELHLFDGQSRSVVGPLGGGCPTGLAFDAAGSLISVSQFPTNEILRWDVDPLSWRSKACDLASRNFTRDEWNIYFSGEPYRQTCPDFPTDGDAG